MKKHYVLIILMIIITIMYITIINFKNKNQQIIKQENKQLKLQLKIKKKENKATIITIVNELSYSNLINFIGSIHKNLNKKTRIMIYYTKLKKEHRYDMRMWKNVEIYNVFELFTTNNEIYKNVKTEVWKELIINHSLKRYQNNINKKVIKM
jgi:hypothetical protein